MFKKLFAAIVVVAAAGPTAAEAANHGFYASFDAGAVSESLSGPFTALPLGGLLALDAVSPPNQSPDIGWAVSGAVGMRLNGPLKLEGELGYRTSNLSSVSSVDHLTVMADLLYDIPLSNRIALSLGGGIGADRVSWTGQFPAPGNSNVSVPPGSDAVWRFAVQAIVGVSFKIAPATALDLKYRYMVPTGAELPYLIVTQGGSNYQFTATDVQTHTISLGLTFDLE